MLLLKLLRADLFGETVDKCDLAGTDWEALFEEARRQTVVGLVGEALGYLPTDLRPDNEVMRKFLSYSIKNLQNFMGLDGLLAEITEFYRSHGINGIVLKGQGVARYYRNPEARVGGDIDFYIPQGHFKEAVDLAVDRWQGGRRNIQQETYKHYEFMVGPLMVELHRIPAICRRPWQKKRFNRWMLSHVENPANARHIDINGVDVMAPGEEFDAVYIFYHAFSHLIGNEGIGLRHMCDWAMVLKRAYELGLAERVGRVVAELGLQRPWRIMGYILVNFLGLPEEAMPLYSDRYKKESMRLMEQVMEGGNFGSYSENVTVAKHKGMWTRKFTTFRRFNKNLRRMWYLSPKDMVGAYMWYTVTGFKRAVVKNLRMAND